MKQICIYPKEVAILLGKSLTTAQTLVRTIKDVHGKDKHQALTIREFCAYMGLPYTDVFNMINRVVVDKELA
ncbi:hypothetical protein FG167_00710 [Lacinutrix sp. WUR7]|uniref:hypothetical protein n=1 Tax=Lacinutrix sp. WUR7 TaxID=2653681 RepID=UPI00193E5A28|nr:hypothetical protein [Lacinutrix sp. WUR7]QRM87798.1 hypothetical protein FG167_00710 [Lacinutrix sp. WUR7]